MRAGAFAYRMCINCGLHLPSSQLDISLINESTHTTVKLKGSIGFHASALERISNTTLRTDDAIRIS